MKRWLPILGIVVVLLITHGAIGLYGYNIGKNGEHSRRVGEYTPPQDVGNSKCVDWASVIQAAGNSSLAIYSTESEDGKVGSAIAYSADGYAITSRRLLDSLKGDLYVFTQSRAIFKADLVGDDPFTDIAVLKVRETTFPERLRFGDVHALRQGDGVATLTSPLLSYFSASTGVVSALQRPFWITIARDHTDGEKTQNVLVPTIQLDAAVNPGSEGGAVLNGAGEIVGMVLGLHPLVSEDGQPFGSVGLNYALPIDLVSVVADRIIAGETLEHIPVPSKFEDGYFDERGLIDWGAKIIELKPGGFGQLAGLEVGDIILGLDDREIDGYYDLYANLKYYFKGDSLQLQIYRDGEKVQLDVQF